MPCFQLKVEYLNALDGCSSLAYDFRKVTLNPRQGHLTKSKCNVFIVQII
jgi:hypothetical protein